MDSMYFAALSVGLAGAGHCLGMCGGIAAALQLGGSGGVGNTLAYHGGRILSYGALGAAAGLAAGSIDTAAWALSLRYLAGALLVLMGLYIADWWRALQWLERAGSRLWRPVQRLGARWLPLQHWYQALFLGLCWGMMPCGLIYSALALAATRQQPLESGLMMLAFGVGTLPAMLASSLGAGGLQAQLRRRGLRLVIALLLIAAGSWSLYLTAAHSAHLRHLSAGETQEHTHRH